MKKLLTVLLSVLMLFSVCACAEGTDDRFAASVEGVVLDITETGSLILYDKDEMLYEVLSDEDTDILDAETLNLGDYVTVWYNGQLTRSFPAQLTATKVSCFALTGVVSEVTEEGFTLTTAEEMPVIVNVAEGAAASPIVEGTTVTVYYNGMMTRSFPGQINAIKVRCVDLSGEVVAVNEDKTFTLKDETMGEVIVHTVGALFFAQPEVGATVRVATNGMMTMSIPAQCTAVEILPAE